MKIKLLQDTAYHSAEDGILREGKAGEIVEADGIAARHLIEYRLAELAPAKSNPPAAARTPKV
jgi:hypothetical protein